MNHFPVDAGTIAISAQPALILQAMQTVDEAIGIYDADDTLVAFNARYGELRSAIGGEVRLGTAWIDLVAESLRCGAIPEAKGREQEWLEHRRGVRGSYSIIRKLADGRAFKVNERRTASGGIAVVWTDVSELVAAGEPKSRNVCGDDQRLQDVGQLLAEVTHDFNNVLATILLGVGILGRRLTGDQGRLLEVVRAIGMQADYGKAVVDRVLSMIRRETVIDVGSAIAGMSSLLRLNVSELIDLDLFAPAHRLYARIDPRQLEAATLNLVLNARDAIDGRGKIIVSVEQRAVLDKLEPENGFVVVSVTDTGSGMDSARLAHATDRLFTTKPQGTGLGLSIVQRLTESAGGYFKLHSTLGMGTTAEMWFRAA